MVIDRSNVGVTENTHLEIFTICYLFVVTQFTCAGEGLIFARLLALRIMRNLSRVCIVYTQYSGFSVSRIQGSGLSIYTLDPTRAKFVIADEQE